MVVFLLSCNVSEKALIQPFQNELYDADTFENMVVQVRGIKSQPGLNDKFGTIQKLLPNQRCSVLLRGMNTPISICLSTLHESSDPVLRQCLICKVGSTTAIGTSRPYCRNSGKKRILAHQVAIQIAERSNGNDKDGEKSEDNSQG